MNLQRIIESERRTAVYIRIGWMLMVAIVSGCSLENTEQKSVAGPTARIRIDEGMTVYVYPGKQCFKKLLWGGRDKDFQPYTAPATYTVGYKVVKTSPPIHLGMPVTPSTPTLYNEYYVEAHKPVMISVSDSSNLPAYGNAPGYTTFCGPVYSTFVPEAGKDYEIKGVAGSINAFGRQDCGASIGQILKQDQGVAFLTPVPADPAVPCQ
jgi:hypothetical protein